MQLGLSRIRTWTENFSLTIAPSGHLLVAINTAGLFNTRFISLTAQVKHAVLSSVSKNWTHKLSCCGRNAPNLIRVALLQGNHQTGSRGQRGVLQHRRRLSAQEVRLGRRGTDQREPQRQQLGKNNRGMPKIHVWEKKVFDDRSWNHCNYKKTELESDGWVDCRIRQAPRYE